MQFTARNRSECPDDDRWRSKYARALQFEDVDALLELVEEVKGKKDMGAREIHSLCLENALRFSEKTRSEEKCFEIISLMPRTECLPAKLEFFENRGDYRRALSILRQIEKREDTPSLVRKRRDLESKCPLGAYEGVKRRVFRADASNMYVLLIVLSKKIEKGDILVTDSVRLTVSSYPSCSWLGEIEAWMIRCLPSAHLFGNDSAVKSWAGPGKVPAEECVQRVLECFAGRLRTSLGREEKNVFLHPISVLASFLPPSRLGRSLVPFLCFLASHRLAVGKSEDTQKDECKTEYAVAGKDKYARKLLQQVGTAVFRYGPGSGRWEVQGMGEKGTDCCSRTQQLDRLFVQYLLGASAKKTLEYIRKNPLLGLWKPEQLHFRVLEEALRRQDPDMAVIMYAMISCAESAPEKEEADRFSASHCMSAYRVAHPIAQAYLLQCALDSGSMPDQAAFFAAADLHLPRSIFGYVQAVYLLDISPPGMHLRFFSRFFSSREISSRGIIRWSNKSGTFTRVLLNCLQIKRARLALGACLRSPKKMLPATIDPDGSMTHKVIQVFLHRQAYVSALSLRPFDCKLISKCIRRYAEQAEEAVRRQKAGISRIYAKIIACSNLFVSSACNRHSLLGVEALAEVYPILLGFLALLELGGKKNMHRTTKEIQPTRDEYTGLFSALKVVRRYFCAPPCAQGLDDNSSSFRLSLGSEGSVKELLEKEISDNGFYRNEYEYILGYDLWMIAQRKVALKKQHIAVLSYAIARVTSLGPMEYDTLLKIRGKRIRESFWGKIFRTAPVCGAERMEVIRKETSQKMHNEYLHYLTRQQDGDLSYFMFPLLKKGTAATKKHLNEAVHKMFFTKENTVVTDFSSWVPGTGVIKRKEYFMFLFSYLEENDIYTLELVKSQLRKKGFGVN